MLSTSWPRCCFLPYSLCEQDKKRRIATGERVVQPFHRSGLRRFSRHPNYFAEIAMWSAFYLFARRRLRPSGCTGPPSAASASPCRLQVPGLPGPTRRQRRR